MRWKVRHPFRDMSINSIHEPLRIAQVLCARSKSADQSRGVHGVRKVEEGKVSVGLILPRLVGDSVALNIEAARERGVVDLFEGIRWGGCPSDVRGVVAGQGMARDILDTRCK